MLVSPPYIPYAPALERYGLDLSRLLVIQATSGIDTLWSMEQALRSGACTAVIAWVDNAEERALRRLQLAAEAGACWAVLFRPSLSIGQRSPAPLRIELRTHECGGRLELQIVKQRSGLPATVWVNASDA
jgi:cell division inhibitor SulA/protein ImuA